MPTPFLRRLLPRLFSRHGPNQSSTHPQPNYHPILTPLRTLRTSLLLPLQVVLAFHLLTTHFYTIAYTLGPSMLPTLSAFGDGVLISCYYRRGRGVKVGDLVSFDSVVEPGERVIKRVMGLEGDCVLKGTPGSDGEGGGEMVQIPKGHCWVTGDNLPFSRDSRHFGPMPMALIRGKVIAKAFPWSERCWIENPFKPVQAQDLVQD